MTALKVAPLAVCWSCLLWKQRFKDMQLMFGQGRPNVKTIINAVSHPEEESAFGGYIPYRGRRYCGGCKMVGECTNGYVGTWRTVTDDKESPGQSLRNKKNPAPAHSMHAQETMPKRWQWLDENAATSETILASVDRRPFTKKSNMQFSTILFLTPLDHWTGPCP